MRGQMSWAGWATMLISCIASSGCGSHLAYVHNAALGVDVVAATDGTTHVAIGYDNETFAVVPKYDEDGKVEAMTLVSVSNVDVDGLDEIVFNHVVATGDA